MKLSIILCIVLATGLMASQDDPTQEELLQTVDHIQRIAEGAINDLVKEKEAHANTQAALDRAKLDLTSTQQEFDGYKLEVKNTVDRANEAIAAHDNLVKHLHRAKWIATALVLAACGLAVMKIGGKIGLMVGAIAAPSLIAFVWTWL